MDHKTWADRQNIKAETILRNQENRSKRTPQEQIDFLDKKFGKGLGAKKERAKLLALINIGK